MKYTGTQVHLAAQNIHNSTWLSLSRTYSHTCTHIHANLHPYWSDEIAATSSFTSPAEVTIGFARTASLSDST